MKIRFPESFRKKMGRRGLSLCDTMSTILVLQLPGFSFLLGACSQELLRLGDAPHTRYF